MKKTNKRIICFIIAAFFFAVRLLSACSRDVPQLPATDIMARLAMLFDNMPVAGMYFYNGADEFDGGYLSPATASYIYNGRRDPDFEALDMFESYAIRLSASLTAFEIHIIIARNLSDVPAITKLLEKRAGYIKSLNSDGIYENIILPGKGIQTEVIHKGKYVLLLSTTNNEAAKKLINTL